MAFVLTGGFARVSSFFWHFRRSFKFTAAPIANYVRSRCKVCCHHIAINQPLLFRTRFRMTYCRNTDLISSDEDTFDEIWSESDHLIWHQLDEPALAEVVDERGVHELVLKQNRGWLKNRRIIFPTWATVCTINILCCRKCERTWGFKERIWEMP